MNWKLLLISVFVSLGLAFGAAYFLVVGQNPTSVSGPPFVYGPTTPGP